MESNKSVLIGRLYNNNEITLNEAREMLGYKPLPQGDQFKRDLV